MNNFLKNDKLRNSFIYILLTISTYFLYDYLYSLYNTNYQIFPLGKNLRYMFIFAIILSFVQKFSIRMIIISVSLFFSLIQFCNFQYFGNYVQPIAFLQFFINVGEVTESFLPVITQMIVPFLIVVFAFFVFFFLNKKLNNKIFSLKYGTYIFGLGLLGHLIAIYIHLQPVSGKINHKHARQGYPRPREHSFSNFMRSANSFLGGILPKKLTGEFPQFPISRNPILKSTKLDLNIVFIVGESLRFDHLSLLGYNKNTTPLLNELDKKDSSFFAKKVFSGGLMTKTSFNVLFNRLKYPGLMTQTLEGKNNLFKLAKKNNFNTYFISDQTRNQLIVLDVLMSRKDIDFYSSKTDMNKYIKEQTSYDEDLLSMIKRVDLSENNFIVLQQRGSHSPYKKQYPKNFEKFKLTYDNTVLYTDYVLANILKYFKENSKKETYFIFVSDHGELLGEHGKNGHGWFEKEVYRVPFIFVPINSNKNFTKKINGIKCQYDISNLITNLLGYETDYDEKDKREIYINGSDLDALAGYLKIDMENNKIISKKMVR